MPSPYNLLIQSTQVDTQNAIDRRSPLPGLADVHYGGPIPGYDGTAITTWDVVQRLWQSAYENAEADIFAYGNAYANDDDPTARTAAANAVVADFQQSVDAFAAKYPNLGFRLFLQDGGENKFVSPDSITLAATSNSSKAALGSSPQNRSVVTMAFNNTHNNTGLYQSAYYSTSTGSTKGFTLYMAGGVFRLNTSNGRQIAPMFCLRLSVNQLS
jgi:hypothetical protein